MGEQTFEVVVPQPMIITRGKHRLPEGKAHFGDRFVRRRGIATRALFCFLSGRQQRLAGLEDRACLLRQTQEETLVPGPLRAIGRGQGFRNSIANHHLTEMQGVDEGGGNRSIPGVQVDGGAQRGRLVVASCQVGAHPWYGQGSLLCQIRRHERHGYEPKLTKASFSHRIRSLTTWLGVKPIAGLISPRDVRQYTQSPPKGGFCVCGVRKNRGNGITLQSTEPTLTFEAPQKTNPHNLTVNQHTLPRASIARFANEKGAVQVLRKATGKRFHAKPADQIFCAQRVWNQQAEGGFMKDIEDDFQAFASAVLDDPTFRLGPQQFALINEFYCLWKIRAQWKKTERLADPSITSVSSAFEVIGLRRNYTQDEQEQLEAAGIGYIRPDLTISSRSMVTPAIRLNLSEAVRRMDGESWKILRAMEGEFVVPDNFSKWRIVPLSPTACLCAHPEVTQSRLPPDGVAIINRLAIESSIDYYFARDLDECPQ